MIQYLELLRKVMENGEPRNDRTKVGTRALFAESLKFDLSEGFPLLTTKKLPIKSIVGELLWMLTGDDNLDFLHEHGIKFWDSWADSDGNVGPVYGSQWRRWRQYKEATITHDDGGTLDVYQVSEVDQILNVISSIKTRPAGRRHIVSAWNVSDIDDMALPPCPLMFQFFVHNDGRLSMSLTQRSADLMLGVPFDIAVYSLLVHMVAAQTGLEPGTLTINFGDVHVYDNHVEQARQQLLRVPQTKLARLELKPAASIDDYTFDHVVVHDYIALPHIKCKVAV